MYVCVVFGYTRKYYPSSKQFRDPPTYTHQPSMQQKVPFSLIRCSSSKVAFCSCVEWGWHIYNIVESESDPLTRRVVDVFEKEPLKGNSEVHLHTPTKFGDDRSKDLGGDREQTDRQTNRQTDKRCSIYSMICSLCDVLGEQIKNWKRTLKCACVRACVRVLTYMYSHPNPGGRLKGPSTITRLSTFAWVGILQ